MFDTVAVWCNAAGQITSAPLLITRRRGMTRSRQAYLLAVALMVGMLLAFSGVAWAATTLRNTSDPVPQTNGRVNAIAVSGDTIYLGGSFTSVGGVARSRLAAIDTSGQLLPWAPHVNRPVSALAVSEDGGRIYAGGRFTRAGGEVHNYVAAIDAVTGAVDPGFDAGADLPVRALAASVGSLYLGGEFGTVNGQVRSRLAQVDANGDLTSWAPDVRGGSPEGPKVLTLELSGSRLYVGGDFDTISGQTRRNLAALVASTGDLDTTWRPQFSRPVYDVEESAVTGSVYVAGGGAGGDGTAFRASDGEFLWSVQGDGDFQGVAYLDGQVYFGGHFRLVDDGTGQQVRRVRLLAVDSAGALQAWNPEANRGVWAVEADTLRTRIYAGGDFTRISGQPQEGFAQFSALLPSLQIGDARVKERNPDKARFYVRLSAQSQGTVRVNYATANGTAKASKDYRAKRGTLTFEPGETTKTIAVDIRVDRRNEPNETFFVNLTGANTIITDWQGKATIIDND
jgi:outer membrane protein assembly factor BamB